MLLGCNFMLSLFGPQRHDNLCNHDFYAVLYDVVCLCAGGEALYRLAIDPSPKMRYILNEQRSLSFSECPTAALCTCTLVPFSELQHVSQEQRTKLHIILSIVTGPGCWLPTMIRNGHVSICQHGQHSRRRLACCPDDVPH